MAKTLSQLLAEVPRRLQRKSAILSQGRARCFAQAVTLVDGKRGLEIGGPTDVFQGWRTPSRCFWRLAPLPIYDRVAALDNCNFSGATMWGSHDAAYHYSSLRPAGNVIIAEGTNIPVDAATYDFVLSSHNLEHFANPVKALLEWKRVTRPHGALILALPHYKWTFDHRRAPTTVDHMFDDYASGVNEDDVTHVVDVLENHDLTMDGFLQTGTFEEFKLRCDNNLVNRSMHHHVFDEANVTELLQRVGLEVLAVEFSLPYHLIVLSRWRS